MKHSKAKIFILFIPILLAGCATSAKYQKMVDSWQGKNAQELVDTWGFPNNVIQAPNDDKVYVYSHSNVNYYPGYCTVSGCMPTEYTTGCTTWFELNKEKVVTLVKFRGSGCVYSK
jgi:hypothetical protein